MAKYRFEPHDASFDDAFAAFESFLAEVGQPAQKVSIGCLADSLETLRGVLGGSHVGRACFFGQRAVPLREWQFGPEMPLLIALRTSLPIADIWVAECQDLSVRDWRGQGRWVASFRVRVHEDATGKVAPNDVASILRDIIDATVVGHPELLIETPTPEGRLYQFEVPKPALPVVVEQLLRRLDGVFATSHLLFGGTLGQIHYIVQQNRYQPTTQELIPGLAQGETRFALEPTQALNSLANTTLSEAKAIGRNAWDRRPSVRELRLRREFAPWTSAGISWGQSIQGNCCELLGRDGRLRVELSLADDLTPIAAEARDALRAIATSFGGQLRTVTTSV